MKTYDETFERVMAERDSYMLKRKKTIKCAALSSTALVAVALCVFTATRAGNTGMINKKSADNNSEAAMVSDNSEYTVPELLSQEITSYFGVEDTTHISEEYTASVQQAADPDAKSQYDSLNETQTAADLCAGVPSKNSGATTTTRGETIPATSKAIVEESALCSVYKYHINSGKYKNYIAGKVIEKEKVGEKIGSVTVTGGWQGTGNATTKETLSADVYYIKGVSDDVAVCLKFNDKGDALTTDHYYVMINTHSDYSAVSDYFIGPGSSTAPNTQIQEPDCGGDEFVTETTVAQTATERTSKAYIPG